MFWVIFVGSFGLYKHYPVVDAVWVVVGRLLVLALALFTLIKHIVIMESQGDFRINDYHDGWSAS